VDPVDPGVMSAPPRPRSERVITPSMWVGIVLVGAISAVGTLLVLDASLPAGLIEGNGGLRYAQTRAFTTLVFFSMFTVFAGRSEERSAFAGLFGNTWLWGAVVLALALQGAVVYTPFLQKAFSSVALRPRDWLLCAATGSSVLWLTEARKALLRARHGRRRHTGPSR
jgi:P-type Ca2+ transporter type 2C